MLHEKDYWNKSCFVTLTYDNNHIPENGYLRKDDLVMFLKRLRKAIEPEKLKYFACGEYGETYGRPHYHAIIFGVGYSVADRLLIYNKWSMGFVKVTEVNKKTCKYVAKYITKAMLGMSRAEKERLNGKPEPYQRCSHGLGLRWLKANAERVGRSGISHKGRQVSVPRYYIDKLREAGLSYQVSEDAKYNRVHDSMQRIIELINAGYRSREAIAELHRSQQNQRMEEIKTLDGLYRNDRDNQ